MTVDKALHNGENLSNVRCVLTNYLIISDWLDDRIHEKNMQRKIGLYGASCFSLAAYWSPSAITDHTQTI